MVKLTKFAILTISCILLFSGLFVAPVFSASSVTLAWDPNSEQDLAGYRIYQSTVSGAYDRATGKVCDVPKTETSCTIDSIPDGTYYWVATAYDNRGNESGYSNEVSVALDATPPSSPKNLKQVSVKITVSMRDGKPYVIATATTGN